MRVVKHTERDNQARSAYQAERAESDSSNETKKMFFSLDLQKVRMLSEIPGVKSAVFTGRICAYNESFSPIGKKKGHSYAMIWHQGIAGRNDEDIFSSFYKFITNLHQLSRCRASCSVDG